jgi:hypothetical protein
MLLLLSEEEGDVCKNSVSCVLIASVQALLHAIIHITVSGIGLCHHKSRPVIFLFADTYKYG